MNKLFKYVFILAIYSCLVAKAAAFLEHVNGQPYVWKPNGSPIVYRVETGDLTASVNNAQARTLVSQAFDVWENVFGAQDFTFNEGTNLGVDINLSNYKDYIDLSSGSFVNKTSDTVVIFDNNGAIIDDLFSTVAPGSGSTILGIASPGLFDSSNLEITAGFVLINGAVTGSDTDVIKATATHELGHLLNLAHAQLNSEQAQNANSADDDVVPTMFPFIPDDATVSDSLELDDQFSMSLLYPDSTEILSRNEIRGHVVRKNREGVRAVNVICRDNSNPTKNAVSYISDQSLMNDGNYVCGLLPSGDYTVQIEAIEQAINTYNPPPPFIETEFYNASNESFNATEDVLTDSSLVSVTGAGNTVEDINIVVNNNGRLFSGQTALSQTFENFSVREFFVNVPSGARSLTVRINWLSSTNDLDLFIKCAPEFSKSSAASNLYAQSLAFSDQVSTTSETITLNGNSNPSLQPCQYHIIVQKFNASVGETVNFSLNVEVDANVPTVLRSKAEDMNYAYQGNEYVVASKVFSGNSESFDVFQLRFQESILTSLDNVTQAALYVDSNNNRRLDSTDELLQQTSSFNSSDLSFEFNDVFFSVGDGDETRLFVTYTFIPQSSGINVFIFLSFVMSVLIFVLKESLCFKRKSFALVFCTLILSALFITCQKPKISYKPILIDSSSVSAVGQTFNDQFTVDIDESGEFDSVTDFFD